VTAQNGRPLCQLIQSMVESLVGQPVLPAQGLHARLLHSPLGAPLSGLELRAASAIDVAAWDLQGKALGQPVYRLLGGTRDRLPVSANWRLMPGPRPEEIEAHVADLKRRGFRALKCPLGVVNLDLALRHVRFVRQCAGSEMKIIVDGNFRWTVKQALRFARETQDLDLFWIEDPVSSHDFEGLAHLSRTITQPTCAGEVFQHPHEFRRLLEGRCCDYVMIDQDLGLTGFAKVAHMAEIHGCAVVNHLAPEVLAHGVAAAPNGLIVGLVPWGQPLFTEPLRIEAGELVMPRGPGLGLTLDEDVLRTCAVD
jgi:L-alanine-DL-glutamate epimerase-like enolase superfamily enzyme